MSDFYFPLTLGRPRAAPRDDERRRPPELEAWREGVRSVRPEVEPIPEDRIFRDLLRPAGAGYTLITGEPGAGKSTLLEQWRRRWAKQAPAPVLGMVVPVLVRFRSLNHRAAELRNSKGEQDLALALWAEHLRPEADTPALNGYYRLDPRVWTPLWLLDGLDEAVEELRTEEFLRRLGNLPGRICLSCRTAIAQSLRPALQPGQGAAGSLEIQPLNAREQRDFLTRYLGNETRADSLHHRIFTNTQMRELAGNPLLLDLIAQVGEEVDLPASRAAFYERAVAQLWTKVTPEDRADDLREDRDTVLTALAASVGLTDIEFPIARLDAALKKATEAKPAGLRGALVTSGLLRLDRKRSTASFLHLTFQEYYLARALADRPFAEVLMQHWASPRHEETLALLLAMTAERDASAADAALVGLVEWGLETHRRNPKELWAKRRSPTRVALHLVTRSGHDLTRFSELERRALRLMGYDGAGRTNQAKGQPFRIALSGDPATPAKFLVLLADDADDVVRWWVAAHPSTPTETLAWLTNDPDQGVREMVAERPKTPPEALARLADDTCSGVRWTVALNPASSPHILSRLAEDTDDDVREVVAVNPATSPEILARLAEDPNELVRGSIARNPATSPEIFAELTEDPDYTVRREVAENPAATPEILARLADDGKDWVREGVAKNRATPPEILARLAGDPDDAVRREVAENPATPPDTRTRLATEPDSWGRWGVARYRETPPDTLARLADDPDWCVRDGVAENRATPPEILARLAGDPDNGVRREVAKNPATPPGSLAQLAGDADYAVREGVAQNLATPPGSLAQLAGDADYAVRREVAQNPAAPPETLTRLAEDADCVVRRSVARNPATPPKTLARLATDDTEKLAATRNPALVLEDLLIPPRMR